MSPTAASKQHPLNTLVAAARRLTSTEMSRVGGGRGRRRKSAEQTWQDEAREMYRNVGEYQYVVDTIAGKISAAKLYVGKVSPEDPSNDPEPVTDNDEVNDVLAALGGTFAGRSQLLNRLGINLLVPGDGWLCGIPQHLIHPDEEQPESGTSIPLASLEWRALSIKEVQVGEGEVELKLGELAEPINVSPEQVYLIRVWDPDPFEWWEASSSSRANLPVLKELVGLTMHIGAQIDSRLAGAGILLVPSSAQRALQAAAGMEEDAATDEFTEALVEAMTTPISDRSSASAVVPLVVTVPDDVADKFQHITFSTPLDAESRELREEAIRRLALGMDAPPEVLLGSGDSNHWGAWAVSSDFIEGHIEPILALICDAITTQYLWPVLSEQDIEDVEEYVVWYDIAHLISRPNRSQDAMALYDKGVISDVALRRELGFDEDDAPEADDPVMAMILEMVQSNPGILRSPALPQMIEALQAIASGNFAALTRQAEEEAPAATEEPTQAAPVEATTTVTTTAQGEAAMPGAMPGVASPNGGQGETGAQRLPMTSGIPTQGVDRVPVG